MRDMDGASVDAIVTDPPYGLEFMGKEWDKLPAGNFPTRRTSAANTVNTGASRQGGRQRSCEDWAKRQARDMRASQEWHQAWATEAFRVLKPGGHLLAFGGTRTYHRLACAVEDAGFEIRDSVIWLYGSGFPKSLDVSKAIDKAAGAEREVVGEKALTEMNPYAFEDGHAGTVDVTAPATPEAQRWQGWGTALKPAHEPIVVARKPLVGTVAQNVTEHGTGALNVDGCRVDTNGEQLATPQGDPGKRAGEVGADLGITDASVEDFQRAQAESIERTNTPGRWPANVVLSPGAAEELDRQSGERGSGYMKPTHTDAERNVYGQNAEGGYTTMETYGDSGGASRFFYCAKASRGERNAGLDGFEERGHRRYGEQGQGPVPQQTPRVEQVAANHHPTVKPIALMRWLVRLVTPPGGTVLDPFAGSGTTGIAAVLEDFDFIGVEREAEYVEIARARLAWWEQHRGREAEEVLAESRQLKAIRENYEAMGQLKLLDE